MKIAFVTEHLDSVLGGQEAYMRDFSSYLAGRGHEVHFFTQSGAGVPPDIRVHTIRVPATARLMRWTQWLSFLRRARAATGKGDFDIVMGTGRCLGVTVYQPHGGVSRASHIQNALLEGGLHARLKSLFNLVSPKHRTALRIERLQFSDPRTRYIAISEMVKGHMQTFYGVPEEKITLIYNGVDTSRFVPAGPEERQAARRNLGLPEDRVIYGLVAHNFRLKGLRELIEASAALRDVERRFLVVVAGNGKRRRYEAQIAGAGLQDHFRFLGSVREPETVYHASDVYVQPTWYDPCSLVVLESMAAGLPVITTRFNGAGELIDHGRSGYVISSPAAVGELSSAMEKLFDPSRRQSFGRAARLSIESHTLQDNYRAMLEVFEGVVG